MSNFHLTSRTQLVGSSRRFGFLAALLFVIASLPALGSSLVTSTVNAGGGRSTSAAYAVKLSVGEIAGTVSGTNFSLKSGFIAQVAGSPGDSVPVAAFSVTPSAITISNSVTFTDDSTGTITNRFWSFGDGLTTNTTATSLTHTYNAAGSKDVMLIVTGPAGVSTNTQTGAVTVNSLPTVLTPAFSPSGGTFTNSLAVTLTCGTASAAIYYTTDGTEPTGSSTLYSGAFTISNSVTVKAVATKTGNNDSAIASADFVKFVPTVATPTVIPSAGTFTNSVAVTLACATTGSMIYYTTDGSAPTTGSAIYTGAFTLNSSATVKAIAVAAGYNDSAVVSASLVVVAVLPTAATPVIAPSAGTYTNTVQVTVTCATAGSTIRYTTDGTVPTSGSSIYAGAFTLSTTTTVKAVAFKTDYNASAVASAAYAIVATQPTVATPVITPNGGSFSNGVAVAISCGTGSATLRYTLDGTAPTTNSTAYGAELAISNSVTLRVVGFRDGYTQSSEAAASFTILVALPTAGTPSITPSGGTFTNSVAISLSSSTPGATFWYTTDGTTPTTNSAACAGSLTLSNSATLKVIAGKSGYNPSAATSANFTIVSTLPTVATPVIAPDAGTYSNTVPVSLFCATTGATIRYTTDGSDPTSNSPIYTGTFIMSDSVTVKALAVKTGYNDSAVAAVSYTVVSTQPTVAMPAISPGAGTYTNSVTITLSCATGGATIRYTTDGTAPTDGSTAYAGPLTVSNSVTLRVAGFEAGYNQSSEAAASFIVIIPQPTVATPEFSLVGGTYTSSVQVALSCSTLGATIRYTTDGSDPTESSTIYNELITLTESTTLKASGFASGYTTSAVAAESFTINLPVELTILTGNILPTALKGVAYSVTFRATNGTAPYAWVVPKVPKLPAGLKFTPNGLLSGKPSKVGTNSSLLVTVADAAGHQAQRTFSLIVVDPVPIFGSLAGTYTGLIINTNTPTYNSSGSLTLVLSKTGSFAAKLSIHGLNVAFKGQFDRNGYATASALSLGIVLHLDVTGDTRRITGVVTGSGVNSILVADRGGYCPASLVASYTLAFIPANEADETKPQGYGYAKLIVGKTGLGTLTGVLGDAVKLAAKAPVSQYGTWPLYASLYNNGGSCIGWVTLTSSNATGVIDWFAPTFTTTLDLIGSKFVANQSIEGVKLVTVGGGGVGSIVVTNVSIAASGIVTVPAPNAEALTFQLTLKTGQFTGSFTPVGGSKITFNGLLLQEQNGGAGLFQNSGKTGGITIEPAP